MPSGLILTIPPLRTVEILYKPIMSSPMPKGPSIAMLSEFQIDDAQQKGGTKCPSSSIPIPLPLKESSLFLCSLYSMRQSFHYMQRPPQINQSLLCNLFHGIQVRIDDLVHGEHVHLVALEDASHLVVTDDLPLVARILQIVRPNILPYLLHRLWT